MRSLTVLYDAQCGVCSATKRWLARQKALVPLRFVPAGSPEARRAFPQLAAEETLRQLTVVLDGKAVYRGDRALVMCLWALERYRAWALDLAALGRFAPARRFFTVMSKRRQHLSKLLGMRPEKEPAAR